MKITISKDLQIIEMPGMALFNEMCETRLFNFHQAVHERPDPMECKWWAEKDSVGLESECGICNFCALAREYEEEQALIDAWAKLDLRAWVIAGLPSMERIDED